MKTSNLTIKFTFVILFLKVSWGADSNLTMEDQVEYYENLITTEIEQSNNYQLPTDNEQYRPKNSSLVEDFGLWDFIVVGSGCGGAVVANRLSEVPEWNVLLIEAGGPETNFSVIPAMHLFLHFSRFNWGYYSTQQKHACLGLLGHKCPIVKGRALGGSSSINYESYVRGNKNDFNRWAAEGNPGWTYDEILPYFIKSENSEVNVLDPGYHGRNGYWNVKNDRPFNKVFQDFVEGSRIVHNFTSTDYNGRDQLGVFQLQVNNNREFRNSSNSAFLQPIRNRKNLKIITNAYVTKVIIHPLTKNAVGVQFAKDGNLYSANASKEVILSAGAINTPQILMLSGIGPKKHLKQMNILLIKDLPVGKTLYDHSAFYGTYVGTNVIEPQITLRQEVIQFLNDYGYLTMYSNMQTIGFFQTKFESNPTYPDLELEVSLVDSLTTFLTRGLRVTNEIYQAINNSIHYKSIMNILEFPLKAKSVGSVTLKSDDPYQYPIIDSNLLAEKYDVEILYQGILIIQEIIKTEPFRRINATLVLVDYPQCKSHELGSKNYWICAFRLITASSYHQCGTCRMGPNPRTSVVNNKGIVHGFKNLRVVDASIFPSLVAAHTAAPTVMIGERISDFIKLQYGVPIEPITNIIN